MVKRFVWAVAIVLVLLGGAWKIGAARLTYDLTKLKSICVAVEYLSADAKRVFGLSREAIGNHVYVGLKGKLPRLRVDRDTGLSTGACVRAAPTLVVQVNLGIASEKTGGRKLGYYGDVIFFLDRLARWESGSTGYGMAYFDERIITGPMGNATPAINAALDQLLTDFAAEYYKAGNP